MHIDCITTRENVGSISGSWLALERLCRGVSGLGHRIEVVGWPENPPSGPGGPAEAAARLRASCAAFAAHLEQRWQACRPDVVHIELACNTGVAARDAARRLGLPVSSAFHHIHLYAAEAQRQRLVRLLTAFHHGCQRTVAESPTSRALLGSLGGPDAVVIPKGVDSTRFSPARRDPACRAAWQAGPDDLVVFWAGRMVATKGLDLLIRVGDAAHARLPALRLVCAGDGPEAASLRAALPWAHFSGTVQGEALAAAYASSDIFAFTSPDEPWGNVLLEAAASGLAIIARSGGAAIDLLRPAGACVDPLPQAAETFSAALLRLAGDPAERGRLAQAARRAAEAASMRRCAESWVAMWTGLSRRGRRS